MFSSAGFSSILEMHRFTCQEQLFQILASGRLRVPRQQHHSLVLVSPNSDQSRAHCLPGGVVGWGELMGARAANSNQLPQFSNSALDLQPFYGVP